MNHPAVHDRVRLTQALPTLWLQCGDVGVVQSIWLSAPEWFEVEFHRDGESFAIRALIRGEHLEPIATEGVAL
jgi:hypothetical protein